MRILYFNFSTLRADHPGCCDHRPDTSPHINRTLNAMRGGRPFHPHGKLEDCCEPLREPGGGPNIPTTPSPSRRQVKERENDAATRQ